MDDIEPLLARLQTLPLDPRLALIDDAVMAGLARRSLSHLSVSAMAMVSVLSLGIGLAGALAPAQPAHASTIFPLGAPAALAPSTLLNVGP